MNSQNSDSYLFDSKALALPMASFLVENLNASLWPVTCKQWNPAMRTAAVTWKNCWWKCAINASAYKGSGRTQGALEGPLETCDLSWHTFIFAQHAYSMIYVLSTGQVLKNGLLDASLTRITGKMAFEEASRRPDFDRYSERTNSCWKHTCSCLHPPTCEWFREPCCASLWERNLPQRSKEA